MPLAKQFSARFESQSSRRVHDVRLAYAVAAARVGVRLCRACSRDVYRQSSFWRSSQRSQEPTGLLSKCSSAKLRNSTGEVFSSDSSKLPPLDATAYLLKSNPWLMQNSFISMSRPWCLQRSSWQQRAARLQSKGEINPGRASWNFSWKALTTPSNLLSPDTTVPS